MALKIGKDMYLDREAYIVENEYLRLVVLPELGAKIASIFHKPSGYELLHQPVKQSYSLPDQNDLYPAFEKFDTSGLDDCFPTIDACTLEVEGQKYSLPDHGELWSKPMQMEVKEDYILARGFGQGEESNLALSSSYEAKTLPFRFNRTLMVQDSYLYLDYEIENLSDKTLPCMWALHGLFALDKGLKIDLPEGNLLHVMPERPYDFESFDKTELDTYPENEQCKFYLEHPVDQGKASLRYVKQNVQVNYLWRSKDLPYLGVWVTTGGFKKEKNIAIEPCSGFYDNLATAYENQKTWLIEAKQKKRWTIEMNFWPLRY